MSTFFDFDPLTDCTNYFDYDDDTGQARITPVYEMGDVLKYTTGVRNDEDVSKAGIKSGWWMYAKIPPYVEHEMLKKGISIHNQNDAKAMFRELDQNYPWLKTTTKKHKPRG